MTNRGWFPTLPAHWADLRLGRVARVYSGGTPDKSRPEYWEGGTIPWLNSGAVNDFDISKPSALITNDALSNSSARWVRKGSVVMALAGQGRTKGLAGQLLFDATCNQSMAAISPTARLEPRFLLWWLTSSYSRIRGMGGGDLRDGLNLDHVRSIPVPLPPFEEQQRIAAYLDKETARIEELISKQEQLLITLADRRQALVSRAVTWGMDENAPRHPSGDERIGLIPSHWDLIPARHLVRIRTGSSDTVDATDEGEYPFYVRSQTVERASTFEFNGPAVLTAGDGAGVGKVFHLAHGRFAAHQRVYVMDRFRRVTPEYFFHYFSSMFARVVLAGTAKSTVESLRRPMLADLRVTVPPIPEQEHVIKDLEARLAEVDLLQGKADEMIALLRERRQALISAAVTGQINVGGE